MSHQKSKLLTWLSWTCGGIVILLTLLGLLSLFAWNPYLELTSHFKVQYFLISLLSLIGLFILRSKRLLLIALFCLTLQLVDILPWYFSPLNSFAASSQSNLRVVLSNVYYSNQNPQKFINLVKNEKPDLVVIQEKTPQWITWSIPLKTQLPFFFEAPDDIAIFSRIPLENPTIFGGANQSSIGVTLTVNQQKISIVATHPPPPKPALVESRNAEFDGVINYVSQQQIPVILVGDLNTTMWSPYYKQLEQKTGLTNARRGFGILPTWPVSTPYFRRSSILAFFKPLLLIPIDHCLVSSEIKVRSLRSGTNIDSDHLPLIADLTISKS